MKFVLWKDDVNSCWKLYNPWVNDTFTYIYFQSALVHINYFFQTCRETTK